MLRPIFHNATLQLLRCLALGVLLWSTSAVQAVQMEAASALIAANFGNTGDLTTVTFRSPFPGGTVPVVIVLPSDQGGQPCSVRIDNITNTSFRAACMEPANIDGAHVAMTVHYFAIEPGQHRLATTGSGDIFILAGTHLTTTTIQAVPPFVGAGGFDALNYWNTGTGNFVFPCTPPSASACAPVVLTQIQGHANETYTTMPMGPSLPWLTVAVRNVSTTGFQVALERAEVNDLAPVTNQETIGWVAIQSGVNDTFTATNPAGLVRMESIFANTTTLDGWDNGCNAVNYTTINSATAIPIASQITRNGANGGWLRRCIGTSTNTSVSLTVDEDQFTDTERSHIDEDAGVLVFDQAFDSSGLATRASIEGMRAYRSAVVGSVVEWRTEAETGTLGFNLERLDPETGQYVRVNNALLPARLHTQNGAIYRLVDPQAQVGEHYTYRLVELEATGNTLQHGPYQLKVAAAPRLEENKSIAADLPAEVAATNTQPETDPIAAAAAAAQLDGTQDIYATVNRSESAETKQRLEDSRRARIESHEAKKRRHGPRLQVITEQAGLYYLHAAALARAFGISTREVSALIDSNNLQLRNRGKPVALLAARGASGLYFYAEKLNSPYSRYNVYWVGRGEGLEMPQRDRRSTNMPVRSSYLQRSHAEGNRYDLTHLFDNPDADYWVWDYRYETTLYPNNLNQFSIPSPGRVRDARIATLTVRLHGGSAAQHRASVAMNGQTLGTVQWRGLSPVKAKFKFQSALLQDGENSITVFSSGSGSPNTPSLFYINDFDLDYQRRYTSNNGQLAFNSARHRVVSVDSFKTNTDLRVFDLNDPYLPQRIKSTVAGQPGNYRISFRAGRAAHNYLAISLAAARRPKDIIATTPSQLRRRSNRADWLIITSSDMLKAAQRLARYRRSQGLYTQVVDIEDIYAEFSYGITNADAIWSFLRYAYTTWQISPRYVVLAGEGSFDYKNYLGHGDAIIPALLTPTPNGLVPSDNLYADVEGNDWLPEIAIGRLPVINAAELTAVAGKLIRYEKSQGPWTREALISADKADSAGNFPADSDAIGNLFPAEFSVERIHLDELDDASARQLMRDGINLGKAFVNFFGHGGYLSMGNANLLSTADIPTLSNNNRLPVVTAFSCLIGQFGFPGQDSVAEALLLPARTGAVAVWSPSGLSYNNHAVQLAKAFYQATFKAGERSLGETILRAQKQYARGGNQRYLLDIYNLIGDPATVMK